MSTCSPGDEAAIPYAAAWDTQTEEGKRQVVFALRREAIELYGDLLPHNGCILRGRSL